MDKQKLENIGFYTLEDRRARHASASSPLWRCELLVTPSCNFSCPYCRGVPEQHKRTLRWEEAKEVLDAWIADGLKNVRFTGGEPTMWHSLNRAVDYCRLHGVQRIAISTNGSADPERYVHLFRLGVNDFSVSLDACCSATAGRMASASVSFEATCANIRRMASLAYTTVGIVLTEDNLSEARNTILLAHNLGVADIRVVPAAQWKPGLATTLDLPSDVLDTHPILRYRVKNIERGRPVRGIRNTDPKRCPLVLDDMAVMDGEHYPCVIYMREWGKPIGSVGPDMRQEREQWCLSHDTHTDPICRANCLDVCVDYNRRFAEMRHVQEKWEDANE